MLKSMQGGTIEEEEDLQVKIQKELALDHLQEEFMKKKKFNKNVDFIQFSEFQKVFTKHEDKPENRANIKKVGSVRNLFNKTDASTQSSNGTEYPYIFLDLIYYISGQTIVVNQTKDFLNITKEESRDWASSEENSPSKPDASSFDLMKMLTKMNGGIQTHLLVKEPKPIFNPNSLYGGIDDVTLFKRLKKA